MNLWYGARQGEISRHEILCWCAAILMLVSFTALGMLLIGIEGAKGLGDHTASIAMAFAGAAILPAVFWPTVIVSIVATISALFSPVEQREMGYWEAYEHWQRMDIYRGLAGTLTGVCLALVIYAMLFDITLLWSGLVLLGIIIIVMLGWRERKKIPPIHWEHIKREEGRELAYQLAERERSRG